MHDEQPTHAILILLTIQIGKAQLLRREMRRGETIDQERLTACLEDIERLSWRIAEEVVAIGHQA